MVGPLYGQLYSSGSKTWDLTTANWGTATGGPYTGTVWTSRTAVVFEGTGGSVSFSSAELLYSVGNITFAASNYTLTSQSSSTSIAFSGTIATGAYNATVNLRFYGSGTIIKTGSGVLTFSNSGSAHRGPINVNGGTIRASSMSYFPGFSGNLTLSNGTLDYSGGTTTVSSSRFGVVSLGSGGGTWSVSNAAATVTLQEVVSGSGSFTKSGAGTLVMAAANTYTGGTTVSAGTLALGINDAFANNRSLTLGNAIFDAKTFTDSLGTLGLTGAATITFGTGGTLAFNSSAATSWTGGSLTLGGSFVSGSSLRFGIDNTGLASDQLAAISASGMSGFALDNSGYLVATAIPEPETYAALAGAAALGFAWRRRRAQR